MSTRQPRQLNIMQMMAYATSVALWEAVQQSSITEEQSASISNRADEIANAMLAGKAVLRKRDAYEIIDIPEPEPELSDILVANPRRNT